jgi:predicted secreted protein
MQKLKDEILNVFKEIKIEIQHSETCGIYQENTKSKLQ